MIKLKFLFGIILLLILVYVLHFASYVFLADHYNSLIDATAEKLVFGRFNFMITFFQSLIVFLGILLSAKCVFNILKNGFFSELSKRQMNWSGSIFIFSAIIAFVMDGMRLHSQLGDDGIFTSILLLDCLLGIVGLIILIIADMAQIGFRLKEENDLTI